MASEYSIRMKAVLDTSEVQQSIDKLRGQQGKGGGGQAGGGLGSLQHTLNRLNTTLQQLQQAIQRLNGRTGGDPSATVGSGRLPMAVGMGNSSTRSRAAAAAAAKARKAMADGLLGVANEIERFVKTTCRDLMTPEAFRKAQIVSKRAIADTRKFRRGLISATEYTRRMGPLASRSPYLENMLGSGPMLDARHRELLAKREELRSRGPVNGYLSERRNSQGNTLSRQDRYNRRQIYALAGGVIAGGVQNFAQAMADREKSYYGINNGWQKGAVAAGVISNVGMGAGMGAMMGGPVGAGIGAAAGLLTSAFEELTRKVKEQTAALEQQKQNFFSAQGVDNQLASMFRGQADRKALEAGNVNYFKAQLREEQEKYNRTQAKMAEEIGIGGEGLKRFNLREYERETQKMMERSGNNAYNDPEIKRRQEVAKLYRANADVLMESDSRIQNLQGVIKSLGGSSINKLKASSAADAAKALTATLNGLRAPDMGNVNSLASQGLMTSARDDEARLEATNDYLREIAQLTREIKDKENQAAIYG